MSSNPEWEQKVRRLAIEMRLSGNLQGLTVDMPVETTGVGQTRGWKGYKGTVREVSGDQVYVEFEASVAPRMLYPNEVRPRVHAGCPCSQCQWSLEHHE